MNLTDLKAIKCKTCGEPLDLAKAQNGVIKCAVCDSTFTLPKTDAAQKVLDFLSQGEHDLDTGKFDDAYTAFNKAAELDKTEPEAYWGMALAEFKIQYLKDEVNNRLQPICHEINDEDFADSANFLKAIRYATDSQRAEYERKGEEIDRIKREFYRLAQTGLDYDCFICVKVTGENGERTADYKYADDIYFKLKGKGYKPFFSERELEGATGADYEARILYALKSSECMLVVCLDEAYLRTKWVKNEYSRFLKLVNDEEKESDSIALVFKGKTIEKLPGKHGKIQGIDLSDLGVMERITSFVENHTPEARKRREEKAKRKDRENEELRNEIAELKKMLLNQQQQPKQVAEAYDKERLKAEKKERKTELKESKKENKETEEKKEKEAEPISPDFEIKDGVLIKYKGKASEVVIPNGVTVIGDEAFKERKSLKEVQIPNGVTSIGKLAFYFCSNLTSIIIPDSVTKIGKYAFRDCRKLTSVRLPESVTLIDDYIFYGCSSLTEITIPNSVTSIGSSAFSGCSSLTEITIPDSVTSIGSSAFGECIRLTAIAIPNSVTSIEREAFSHCRDVESIVVATDNPTYKSQNNCILTKDGKTLVLGCKNSIIPEGVVTIWYEAFCGCSKLTSVTIPSGVKDILDNAFSGCKSLKPVIIPDSVTNIGYFAFARCNKFKTIVIPKGVKKIGALVFEDIPDLTIYCRADKQPKDCKEDWNAKEFLGKEKFQTIWGYKGESNTKVQKVNPDDFEIEDGVLKKYKGTATEVVIPDGVTKIEGNRYNGAFYDRSDIKSITIPSSVKCIGDDAFGGCKGLMKIEIPNGVTEIGRCAFSRCVGLKSITIPNSVKRIGAYAFEGCTSLTHIEISDGVTSIGNSVFEGCIGLTHIHIPSSVISIDIPNSITIVGDGMFYGCSGLESITVDPDNPNYKSVNNCVLTKDGKTLILGCKTSIIPQGVSKIDYYAFEGCFGLTHIEIPDSVTTIGYRSFAECNDLVSITIPESVTSIECSAFWGCKKLKKVVVPTSVVEMQEAVFMRGSVNKGYISNEKYNEKDYENLIIYCRAKKQPNGWHKNWCAKLDQYMGNKFKTVAWHKVKWGYKGD